MNRKEFLELAQAILGGIAIHGVAAPFAWPRMVAGNELLEGSERDDFYLEKGLTGMARAAGWFDAHWGAAVLAGHYLCAENQLDEETVTSIRHQLKAMIALRQEQFAPFAAEQEADGELVEEVPKALAPALQGGLRAHGHAPIFAALALKALRDVPHMAQPQLIEGLCALSRQIASIKPQKPAVDTHYASPQAMIDATIDSLLRFQPLVGYPSVRRPNFTHMTTHTEALMSLEAMGYRDLARTGHAGHRAHIAAPVPSFRPDDHPRDEQHAMLDDLASSSYWRKEENVARWNQAWNESTNPNGYWVAFGHLFKVLYSYHRLIEHVEEAEKVRRCSLVLLERYLNPAVQGG